jgi:mRNA-degrading endonuclease RelE of RelBE toxin-antitoxin system
MSLDLRYVPEIVEDRRNLDSAQRKETENTIEEVSRKGKDHENVKLVPNSKIDHPIWELKIKGENTDHRVFLDIEGKKLVVLAVWDFEFTHSGDRHWKKLQERMK